MALQPRRRMKVLLAMVPVFLALAIRANAIGPGDLGMAVQMEHRSYLKFENIHAFVTVRNSGFDEISVVDPSENRDVTLKPVLERLPGGQLPEEEDRPGIRPFRLRSGAKELVHFDVTKWFGPLAQGKYAISVEFRLGSASYRSEKILFDVVGGIEITRQQRSVPGYPDRVLTYSLRYWHRPDRGHPAEWLFLVVDDEDEGLNYGVFNLGRLLRVTHPEMDIEPGGIVRVVHQMGRDCFARSVLSVSGAGVHFVDQTLHLPHGEPYPRSDGTGPSEKVLTDIQPLKQEPALKRAWRRLLNRGRSDD
ncbi:MAG: hypothetical protein FJ224_02895 [Lentisphaerae bacterium]|nr:hypothetical protein [Lentisphaerota bacterium]